MAIRSNSNLEEIFGKDGSKERFQIWLWHYLVFKKGFDYLKNFSPSAIDAAASVIKNDPSLESEIILRKDIDLIDESYFSWIGDDGRQSKWLLGFLSFKGLVGSNLDFLHSRLIGKKRIVAIVDSADSYALDKINFVADMRSQWNIWIAGDNAFDWFKKKSESARCGFFWEWLLKNYGDHVLGRPAIENHQDVLEFFDSFGIHKDAQLLAIEKVKKAWSQKQYRKNLEGKKQCNLILSEKTVKLLDKLSEKYGLAKSEIIDLLIRDESEKGVYIPGRLARKRDALF